MTHRLENQAKTAMDRSSKNLVKQLSKFVTCLVGTMAMCLSAYTLTVNSLIQNETIPASYKWFLLKEVPGPRIIFESGSNSHHAIDTNAVGEALGMTAINIADNGGYAIEDKITRLETYARPGDIIVLPLEWTFYHREKLTDNYVETLFTDNRDYYQSMPVMKRVQRALSLPPEKVIKEFRKKKSRPASPTESPAKNLFLAALTQSTGHESRQESIGPGLGVAEQSCDDYILGKATQRKNLKLGANLKPALKRLWKLKAKGINVHFAWPVLVGDGCMSDPAYVTGFRNEIEHVVNRAGFEYFGTPSQSLYGQHVQDDSPYHILTQGANIHTRKMIGFLRAQGYGKSGSPLNIETFARHRLLEMELASVKPLEQPALPVGQSIAMDDPEMRQFIEFSAGWWAFEPFGRWMRDNRAMFRVTLPTDIPPNSVLKIQGRTKSGQVQQVNISVNGKLISSGTFGEGVPLLVPVSNLPLGEALCVFLSLPDAGPPESPLDRGENQDVRSMTIHVQNVELTNVAAQDNLAMVDLIEAPATTRPSTESYMPDNPSLDYGQVSLVDTTLNGLPADGTHAQKPATVSFSKGWWAEESYGRWMKDQRASLKMVIPENRQGKYTGRYVLRLEGDFFMNRSQTVSAIIDGTERATFTRAKDGALMTAFENPAKAESVNVIIELSGQTTQSPKALGVSQDDRTLTYFLKSAQLIPA